MGSLSPIRRSGVEGDNEVAEETENQKFKPLTDSQRQELDRRKAEHERDPDAAKPWSEIKARLEGRHR